MAHEQNYVPHPQSDVPTSGCSGGSLLTSNGAPTCAGFEGQSLIDLSTGNIYEFQSGSWVLTVSGGGGVTEVFSGNYGGGTPTDTPTTSAAVAFDTSTGTLWGWYGGAWH